MLDSAILHKKELQSFILTQLDVGSSLDTLPRLDSANICTKKPSLIHSNFNLMMAANLEFCNFWFRYCHFAFKKTLSSSSQILTQKNSDSMVTLSWSNVPICTWAHLFSKKMMTGQLILNSAIFNFFHDGFSHLRIPAKTPYTCQDSVPTICTKKPSLIHSDSTWWWQPSWILPCWIQTLQSWIQTLCYLSLRFT